MSPCLSRAHCSPHSLAAGITAVRLTANPGAHLTAESARGALKILYALAGALAPDGVPLTVNEPQVIDMGGIPAFTLDALASTLLKVTLLCRDFQPQHWEAVCSLRSLQAATLRLIQRMPPPALQTPFAIQSMQLTSLKYLSFRQTTADAVAPLMAHASGLTALTTLSFQHCSLGGPLPAQIADLPQLQALFIVGCTLAQLPQMAALTQLEELQLQGNSALTDLQPVLATRHHLKSLVLQDTAPLTEANVHVLQNLCGLTYLDISKRSWDTADYAVLGHLVQMTNDRGCKLIV